METKVRCRPLVLLFSILIGLSALAASLWLFQPEADIVKADVLQQPLIVARYGPDAGDENQVWGQGAAPSRTVIITVSTGAVGSLGSVQSPADASGYYETEALPPKSIAPGHTVAVNFGNGAVDQMTVVPIVASANVDADQVVVEVPPDLPVHVNAGGPNGWWDWGDHTDPISSSTGVITFDLGTYGYDIVPGTYFNVHTHQPPNGHNTQFSFRLPAPELELYKWNEQGAARLGGVFVYSIAYQNKGDALAENVTLVDHLPRGTAYLGDTSGDQPDIGADGLVTWTLGSLAPGEGKKFLVTVEFIGATLGIGAIEGNCALIETTSIGDMPDNNESCAPPVDVWESDVDVGVVKWSLISDPAPDNSLIYELEVCNHRDIAAGPVSLVENVPLSTTLVSWYQYEPVWNEVSQMPGKLELMAPGLPGKFCSYVYVVVAVDAHAPLGANLMNEVLIQVPEDVDLENNLSTSTDAYVSEPYVDVLLDKQVHMAVPVPGGWVNYRVEYKNTGNVALPTVIITDEIPSGLLFEYAHWGGGDQREAEMPLPVPMTQTEQLVAWDLGGLLPGEKRWFHVQMKVSETADAGSLLANCVELGMPAPLKSVCRALTLNPHGPNLAVHKVHEWSWDMGQLHYGIQFANMGTESIAGVTVEDLLPKDVHWNGDWYVENFDEGRIAPPVSTSTSLEWLIADLHPGEYGQVFFTVDLDYPGMLERLYTNTVRISLLANDVVPDDNVYKDVAFSGFAQLEVDVLDPDGRPVAARVMVHQVEGGYEDEKRSFVLHPARFGNMPPGDYWIQAWPLESDIPALANSEEIWVFVDDDPATPPVDRELHLRTPSVMGRVTTPENAALPRAYDWEGNPVPHPALVAAQGTDPQGNWVELWATTNVTGEFSLALPLGDYHLVAEPFWSLVFTYTKSLPVPFSLSSNGMVDLGQIPLTYPRVMGVVVDPDGQRVSTSVILWDEEDYWDWDDTQWHPPFEDKPFRFGGLPEGNYFMRAEPPAHNPANWSSSEVVAFSIPPKNTEFMTLTLNVANFVGHLNFPETVPPDVKGCPGCPVPWVDVRIRNDAWTFEDWSNTGEDGRFTFGALSPDTYILDFFLPPELGLDWMAPNDVTFDLTSADDQVTGTYALKPAPRTKRLVGTVVDEQGNPVDDAWVEAMREDGVYYRKTETAVDGSYDMYLARGVWELWVEPTHPGVDWYFDPERFPGGMQWVEFSHDATLMTETVFFTVTRYNEADFFKITGVVDDPNGDPPAQDTVMVELCDDAGACFGAPVMASGHFTVRVPVHAGGIYYALVRPEPDSGYLPPVNNGFPVAVEDHVDLGVLELRSIEARTARVSGRVIISPTNVGLNGVRIQAWNDDGDFAVMETITGTTGVKGLYALNLTPGHWYGRPVLDDEQAQDYLVLPPAQKEGHVASNEVITHVNFYVARRNATLRGRVVDEQNVVLTDTQVIVFAEFCTDAQCEARALVGEEEAEGGTFEMHVVSGTYELGVWLPSGGYILKSVTPSPVTVGANETITGIVVTLMKADAQIYGCLKEPQGTECLDLEASVFASAGPYWSEDFIWRGKYPPGYGLDVTGEMTWTLDFWVDPKTRYIADPAYVPEEIYLPTKDASIERDLPVLPLDEVITGQVAFSSTLDARHVWVFAKGVPGTDSEDLYFEAKTNASGVYTMYVLPGDYMVGAYVPPHLRDVLWPPALQTWSASSDNPVDLWFRRKSLVGVSIKGSLSVTPTAALAAGTEVHIFGWSEDGDVAQTVGNLAELYELPVISDTTWHVWAAYEDVAGGVFYASEEAVVSVGATGQAGVDLQLEAESDLPESVCETFDPEVFKRISLPAKPGLPEPLIEIPANTLPVTGTAKICATPVAAIPSGHRLIGFAYELEAWDADGNEITESFNKSVRLIFYLDKDELDAALPVDYDEDDVQLVYYSTVRDEWVSLEDTFVDLEDLFVTGKIDHFSKMGLLSSPFETTTSQQPVYLPLILRGP